MKWGIVGAGDIVRKRIIDAIRSTIEAELLAITRRNHGALAAFADEYSIPRRYPDLESMVSDPDIDAVYIATPVAYHAEQTIVAARAGKHVLCEKPIAMDLAEADRMIHACQSAGVTLGIAYYRRFYPVVQRMSELILEGTIGSIAQARIDAFEPFDPPPDHPRSWLLDPATSGGGPMIDFGCHRIELLTALFPRDEEAMGRPDASTVRAFLATSALRREVEDNAVAILRLGGNVLGTVSVSHSIGTPRDTLTIWGSRGSIHCPALNQGTLELTVVEPDGSQQLETEHLPPHENLHQPLIADFETAVAEGREPTVDGATGREVTAILDAIYRS